ncbi:YbjN domain-containing protein [Achromobacter xylosoxidans]
MDDDESEPAVGAISSDTDPASSGEQMQDFNVDVVTSMLDDMGYSPRRSEGDEGPVLVLDPSGTAQVRPARGTAVQRLHREVLRPGHHRHVQRQEPVSLKAINAWNKEYRWSRAYLDEKNQAVLQMDVNAEGAIGKENLQILLNTFISIAEDFSAMVNKGAGK